jgi:hypothetical protein
MLKQLTALVLIAAFVIQTFSGGFVMLDYYTNTTAFATNCVNNGRPTLHCNGKCQMMQKLQQEENTNKQNPGRSNENKTEVFCSSAHQYTFQPIAVLISPDYPPFNNRPTNKIAFDFFQPPRV